MYVTVISAFSLGGGKDVYPGKPEKPVVLEQSDELAAANIHRGYVRVSTQAEVELHLKAEAIRLEEAAKQARQAEKEAAAASKAAGGSSAPPTT